MFRVHPSRVVALLVLVAAVLVTLPAAAADGKVNVNAANVQQLELLPRVGPAVAQRIIDFRKQNGDFKTIDDLALVRGIGAKTVELLKPYVSLSGETTLNAKVKTARAASASHSQAAGH